MNTAKENLLLHPVRMRIILAAVGRQVTTQQLARELPDIPQASLYRNINKLADAGILVVVSERKVHNTLEKTYALPHPNLLFTEEDLKNAKREDYLRIFTQYYGVLLSYYARYIQQGNIDFARDNVVLHSFPLYLNEEEMQKVKQAVDAAFLPYVKNEASAERRRMIFSLLSLPDVAASHLPGYSQAAGSAPEESEPHN